MFWMERKTKYENHLPLHISYRRRWQSRYNIVCLAHQVCRFRSLCAFFFHFFFTKIHIRCDGVLAETLRRSLRIFGEFLPAVLTLCSCVCV